MIAGTEASLEEQGGPSGEHEASRLPLGQGILSSVFLKGRTGSLAAGLHSSEQHFWVKRPQGPQHL